MGKMSITLKSMPLFAYIRKSQGICKTFSPSKQTHRHPFKGFLLTGSIWLLLSTHKHKIAPQRCQHHLQGEERQGLPELLGTAPPS